MHLRWIGWIVLLVLSVTACGHRRPVPGIDGGSLPDVAVPDGSPLPDGFAPWPDAPAPDTWSPLSPECPGGVDKQIFVVASTGNLYRFNPAASGAAAFTLAYALACPSKGQPYSMAVSRGGTAYVLYSTNTPYGCAGLNVVDLKSGGCTQHPTFACGAGGFEVFGMGFVRDGPAAATESLYIGRIQPTPYLLAELNLSSGKPAIRGKLPGSGEYTGTSGGELWGFFGHAGPVTLRRLNKANGAVLKTLKPSIADTYSASAVAAWGGVFYVFYDNRVYKVTPDGTVSTQVQSVAFDVVGAGTACP